MHSTQELWRRFKDWNWQDPRTGFVLDVSRMDLSDDWPEHWGPRFEGPFRAMSELEGGAIANPDERRRVGHYWLRAPELAPEPGIRRAIEGAVAAVQDFAAGVHSGSIRPERAPRFTNALSIGIGGSALGPMFVSQALAPARPPLGIRFIDNTDPDGIDRVLEQTGDALTTTLVVVVSKSGSTPEPRNAALEVERAYRRLGLSFARHAVAVTGEGSLLDRQARDQVWLGRFPMWDWVGGRTSELSAVGLLPAALQGIPVEEMLAGAADMDRATRVPDLRRNPAALMAMCWHHATGGRGAKDMVVLPYKDRLELLSRYLQQLVMESLGKELDLDGNVVNQGLAVYGNKGSTDQHAFVQQLRDGVPNFFLTFIEVLKDRAGESMELEPGITSGDYLSGFYQGTRRALHEKGRASMTVTVPEVSPASVGALIALFERAVGFYASLVNINAYHQPGVEAGKSAAASVLEVQKRVLEVLKRRGAPDSVEEIARAAGTDDVETVFLVLRHLEANGRNPRVPRGA